MKDLHKKKISELDWYSMNAGGPCCSSSLDDCRNRLKQWAIAKIKNCKNIVWDDGPVVLCSDDTKHSSIGRCQSCQDRMIDHEITEEDKE